MEKDGDITLRTTEAIRGRYIPIAKKHVGSFDLQKSAVSFNLPSSTIPPGASEMLVYAGVFFGNCPGGNIQDIKISVNANGVSYDQFIFMRYYLQAAWNSNSDNMWFPVPSDGKINIQIPEVRNCAHDGLYVYLIGYRM
jgi:hypothetical protein